MEKFRPENKETPQTVELKIVEPTGGKNFMIGFEGGSEEECRIYNEAIESVLKQAGLSPFHQIGGHNQPGYHAWEIWGKTTRLDLEELLSSIEQAVVRREL